MEIKRPFYKPYRRKKKTIGSRICKQDSKLEWVQVVAGSNQKMIDKMLSVSLKKSWQGHIL